MASLTPELGLTLRPCHSLLGMWPHPTSCFALYTRPTYLSAFAHAVLLPGVLSPTKQLLCFLQAQLKHCFWKGFLIPTGENVPSCHGCPHTFPALIGLYESI